MAVATDQLVTQVAVRLFGAHGYAAISMDQVRRAAGVSNGSLYHLYPTKASLVARLYGDGMQQCQEGILAAIDAAASPRDAVRDVVAFQAGWVDRNADLARLTYADWHDDVLVAAAPRVDEPSRQYVRVVDGWLRHQIAAGRLLDGPFAVLHALWLGPTQEFCRQWLGGRARLRPRRVADQLADGAWHALRRP